MASEAMVPGTNGMKTGTMGYGGWFFKHSHHQVTHHVINGMAEEAADFMENGLSIACDTCYFNSFYNKNRIIYDNFHRIVLRYGFYC